GFSPADERAVHTHLKSGRPEKPDPDAPVFHGGSARPNARFQALCALAGIRPKTDVETGREEVWEVKDLRKTYATSDAHLPESSVARILIGPCPGLTASFSTRPPAASKRRQLPSLTVLLQDRRPIASTGPSTRRRRSVPGPARPASGEPVPTTARPGVFVRGS